MLSDWDLDTAILGSADHDLHLQVSDPYVMEDSQKIFDRWL